MIMNENYKELVRLYRAQIELLYERIFYLDIYLYITLLAFLAYAVFNLIAQWDTKFINMVFWRTATPTQDSSSTQKAPQQTARYTKGTGGERK